MSDKLVSEQQKIENQSTYVQRLQEDRSMLIEIDKTKNKTIINLKHQIENLKRARNHNQSLNKSLSRNSSNRKYNSSDKSAGRLNKKSIEYDDYYSEAEQEYGLKQAASPQPNNIVHK